MLVCRNKEYAECAVKEIVDSTGNTAVRFELADLSRYGDIRRLVTRWTGPLHGLIDNAACAPRTRQETPEGIEMQFATNVLAYFRLIDQFTDILKTSVPARVVNVASYWAGGLDLNDLEFTRRNYDNDLAYRQPKQASRIGLGLLQLLPFLTACQNAKKIPQSTQTYGLALVSPINRTFNDHAPPNICR